MVWSVERMLCREGRLTMKLIHSLVAIILVGCVVANSSDKANLRCECQLKKVYDSFKTRIDSIPFFRGRDTYSTHTPFNDCTDLDSINCLTYCLSNFKYINENINGTEKDSLGREICRIVIDSSPQSAVFIVANITVYRDAQAEPVCQHTADSKYTLVCERGRVIQWPRFACDL